MATYVLEGTIREIERRRGGATLKVVPDWGFAARRKDADSELTFVVLQPLSMADQGLVLGYKEALDLTVISVCPKSAVLSCFGEFFRVGKVRLELDDSPSARAKSLVEVVSPLPVLNKTFFITKMVERI